MPGAPLVASLLLVAMPFVTSSDALATTSELCICPNPSSQYRHGKHLLRSATCWPKQLYQRAQNTRPAKPTSFEPRLLTSFCFCMQSSSADLALNSASASAARASALGIFEAHGIG